MPKFKKMLSRFKLWLLCYLFYILGYLLRKSYRFRYFGIERLEEAKTAKPAYCLISWHENALAGVLGQVGLPYCFLISQSTDGAFVSFLSSKFGYKTARGSSSKGGKEALLELEAAVSGGFPAAFTVDGPRGPRHQCKPGVLALASKMHIPILPVAGIASNSWVLEKTWDKTKVPPPFAKITYQFGKLVYPPADLSPEAFTAYLEKLNNALHETEKEAQKHAARWAEGVTFLPKPK